MQEDGMKAIMKSKTSNITSVKIKQ